MPAPRAPAGALPAGKSSLSLFVLAGEPSGDRIGADLVRRLRAIVPLSLQGVGGEELIGEGLSPLFPMHELAVMGITDVLRRLPRLLWRVHHVARAILAQKPDIVVLIDAQEFSRLVAKRLRASGHAGPILLYVAPSVWARAPGRARKLAPLFDEVLAVLPFEPAVMARLGGPPTSYVGHPALAEIRAPKILEKGRIALLPGSREGEIRRHLPQMRAAAEALMGEGAVTGMFLPTLAALAPRLAEAVSAWPVPVEIVVDRARRAALYEETLLALSVAGTATLELAMAGVPMVTSYVLDPHQARSYRRLGRPPVALPNILLGRNLVPELVSPRSDPAPLLAEARALVRLKARRADQADGFSELARIMTEGEPDHPREDPASRVLAHWRS